MYVKNITDDYGNITFSICTNFEIEDSYIIFK